MPYYVLIEAIRVAVSIAFRSHLSLRELPLGAGGGGGAAVLGTILLEQLALGTFCLFCGSWYQARPPCHASWARAAACTPSFTDLARI